MENLKDCNMNNCSLSLHGTRDYRLNKNGKVDE